MGFSVGSNGQWTQTFNWKPSTPAQKLGGFASSPLVNDFVSQYGTTTEPNLKDYSATPNYITNMRWKTPHTDAAVQLGDMGGLFSAAKNPNAIYNIFGGRGEDEIQGGAKNDFIQGNGGNDFLEGEEGNDEIWGGSGDDTMFGDDGRDVLYGNEGIDTLYGGIGDDLLLGDEGDDVLYGDEGDDYVFGGEGNDTMYGGDGADRFYLSELSGSGTRIKDFTGDAGDNIHIIDATGEKKNYKFVQVGNDVQIQNSKGTVMATVENAKVKDVEAKTTVGPSRFANYDDTTPQRGRAAPASFDTNRSTTSTTAGQDLWGLATGGTLKGGPNKDILHALGGITTMTGGAGPDNFHVKWNSGKNIITDFNFNEDLLVIDELPAAFEKKKVTVTNEDNNFIVSYDNKEVAQLRKFKGMPMSDAIEGIKNAVRGGQKDAEANYYYGVTDINGMKLSSNPTKTFTLDNGEMTYVPGFAYSAGHRLKLNGIKPEDVKVAFSQGKAVLSANGKAFAEITPPAGTTSLDVWEANVKKALAEIKVNV